MRRVVELVRAFDDAERCSDPAHLGVLSVFSILDLFAVIAILLVSPVDVDGLDVRVGWQVVLIQGESMRSLEDEVVPRHGHRVRGMSDAGVGAACFLGPLAQTKSCVLSEDNPVGERRDQASGALLRRSAEDVHHHLVRDHIASVLDGFVILTASKMMLTRSVSAALQVGVEDFPLLKEFACHTDVACDRLMTKEVAPNCFTLDERDRVAREEVVARLWVHPASHARIGKADGVVRPV
mmetsp:Transcript_23401/g.55264  ORF Transcript_23401/g.55264 Transcript_23401/m.55264 type:complete len:238 (-) Transcript_23401:1003-1716(-)